MMGSHTSRVHTQHLPGHINNAPTAIIINVLASARPGVSLCVTPASPRLEVRQRPIHHLPDRSRASQIGGTWIELNGRLHLPPSHERANRGCNDEAAMRGR